MGQRPREGPVRMRQSRQKEQLFKKGVNITTFLNGIILRAKFPTSKPKWFHYFDHCYIVFHTHQRHNTTQSYISLTNTDIWSLKEQASTVSSLHSRPYLKRIQTSRKFGSAVSYSFSQCLGAYSGLWWDTQQDLLVLGSEIPPQRRKSTVTSLPTSHTALAFSSEFGHHHPLRQIP